MASLLAPISQLPSTTPQKASGVRCLSFMRSFIVTQQIKASAKIIRIFFSVREFVLHAFVAFDLRVFC